MAIIEVPVGPPYGTIPVNTRAIYVARTNATSPGVTDLRIDSAGARGIEVILDVERVGQMLGPDFVRFVRADQPNSACFVNRALWVSIVPHPQIAGVTQINFANHYVPVRATPAQVRQALGA